MSLTLLSAVAVSNLTHDGAAQAVWTVIALLLIIPLIAYLEYIGKKEREGAIAYDHWNKRYWGSLITYALVTSALIPITVWFFK